MQAPTARTVLVAGATGMLGQHIVARLREDGHRIRTLSKDPIRAQSLAGLVDEVVIGDATNPETMADAMNDVDAVISCLGAPMAFGWSDRRSFLEVDTVANLNLVDAARRAGVRRFVYVSLLLHGNWAGTAYARAHEMVVDGLRDSGIPYAIVRPTGIFPVFDPFIPMARRGFACTPGDGRARTNPVHPREVAEVCVAALSGTTNARIPLGGPETLTREDIVRLAFSAVGRKPRILHIPRWMLLAVARVIRPIHPRLAEVTDFSARALTHDFLAPSTGSHRLADHFNAAAAAAASDRAIGQVAS